MDGQNSLEFWQEDRNIPEAVLNGRLRYRDLGFNDARWLVAVWTERGHTVEQIAGWLKCSTRQIKRIRAEVLCQQMRLLDRARRDNDLLRRRVRVLELTLRQQPV